MKTERTCMENKLKTLETSADFGDNLEYSETDENPDKIQQEKTNETRIRSKCDCYKHGESSKNFLSLKKSCAVQNQIRNILAGNVEVNNQKDINNELYLYIIKMSLMRDKTHQNMT